jgi:phosphate starvation-inducible PhoH-like protein
MNKIFICLCFSNLTKSLKKVDVKNLIQKYEKTTNQNLFYNILTEDKYKIIFCSGPAGTGKTLLSCNYAIDYLYKYNEIILTKPLVSVDNEELGFLPGNLKQKMSVWIEHYVDIFNSLYPKNSVSKLLKDNIIQIKPMGYLRGKTFTNSLIIADEMQNSSPTQLKMLLTRIGEGSKLIVLGDMEQKDIYKESGLSHFIHKYNEYFEDLTVKKNKDECLITTIYMENSDIQRSPIVNQVLDIYNFKKPQQLKNFDCALLTKKDLLLKDKYAL